MRMQSKARLHGLELKNAGEYEGKAYAASAVFHLDADLSGTANKKVFGVVTRGFRMAREEGDKFEHLGNSLPLECDCLFEAVAAKDGVQLTLVQITPLAQVKKAA